MTCRITRKELWSLIDRDSPELHGHLEECPRCRILAEQIREEIGLVIADTSALDIPLPDQVGPYKIHRLLGEGGQAFVYEAEQSEPKRRVALKVLKGGRFAGKRRIKHFRREMQSLAALRHDSIATIFDAGRTDEGEHYFAMELVDGVPLDVYVREKKLSRKDILAIFREISSAVHYAHLQGVIHRDLKPSNILIDSAGKPRILDFGLARITDPDFTQLTTALETGSVEGTPRYMSPEQIRGDHEETDGRTDVYSLGVILYELLTGQPPYESVGMTPETVKVICEEPPRIPSSIDRSLRGDTETILLKVLEKDPSRRYQTVKEFAADIERTLTGEPILAKPLGRHHRLGKAILKHKIWLAIAIVAVLIASIGVWRILRPPYNVERVRSNILAMHCRLLEEEPDKVLIAQAMEVNQRYPGLLDADLVSAQAFYMNLHYLDALDILNAELARDPTELCVRLLLNEIQSEAGAEDDQTQAIETELLTKVASAEDLYKCSLATLDLNRAMRLVRECLLHDPDHSLALEASARLRIVAGDIDGAVRVIDELVGRNINVYSWLIRKAVLLTEQGRYAEALQALDKSIVRKPKTSFLYHRRSMINRLMGRYEEALADLTEMIETMQPESRAVWSYYHRGTVNWILGRPDEALADYEKATRYLGRTSYANARSFLILLEMGRTDEARQELSRSRRTVRDDPWLETVLAFLSGDVTAEELLAGVEADDLKRRCEAYYYIGEMHRLEGRDEEAGEWFQRCLDTGLKVDPDSILEPMSEYELSEWRLGRSE